MTAERIDLYGLTREELRLQCVRWGLAPAHAAKLWSHLYLDLAADVSPAAMPKLPERVRAHIAAAAAPGVLQTTARTDSSDGWTRKFLLGLADGGAVETVLMRFPGRVTACVSSQAGCAMGCVFCATGQMGFRRHLTAGEIVAQAVHVARAARAEPGAGGDRLRNIVLMGMGEPLHNYEAVMRAVEILLDPAGLALAADHITLSTVGVAPAILRLAQEPRPPHLAVSLHAATQEERAALVPAAKRWPLNELMAACAAYSAATGRRILYEWTLIAGQNDSPAHARAVGRLLQGLPAQVNLIPLNPTDGYGGAPAELAAARAFQRVLADEFSLPCTIRQRRGIDIAAGCGQLAHPD
jgi:23S rRNA (adenine2503-C2)-methyltransferase